MSTIQEMRNLYDEFARRVCAIGSDTDSTETILSRMKKLDAEMRQHRHYAMFLEVAHDNFMIDTEIQRQRRLSGEFDSLLGGVKSIAEEAEA